MVAAGAVERWQWFEGRPGSREWQRCGVAVAEAACGVGEGDTAQRSSGEGDLTLGPMVEEEEGGDPVEAGEEMLWEPALTEADR